MKKYFALKLIPPRPTFAQDMTAEERDIMQSHIAYWQQVMGMGKVVAFGPVLDPAGAYGLGIVCMESEEEVASLIRHDPANGLNRYEYHPMLAVVPEA